MTRNKLRSSFYMLMTATREQDGHKKNGENIQSVCCIESATRQSVSNVRQIETIY